MYQILAALGYPQAASDWLAKRRLVVIVLLALAAWAVFIVAGWLIWSLLT